MGTRSAHPKASSGQPRPRRIVRSAQRASHLLSALDHVAARLVDSLEYSRRDGGEYCVGVWQPWTAGPDASAYATVRQDSPGCNGVHLADYFFAESSRELVVGMADVMVSECARCADGGVGTGCVAGAGYQTLAGGCRWSACCDLLAGQRNPGVVRVPTAGVG